MASKQEDTWNRVVTFYLKYKLLGLIYTVIHFVAERMSKRIIYNIILTYKKRLTTKRSVWSGRHLRVMTKQKFKQFYRLMNDKTVQAFQPSPQSLIVTAKRSKNGLKRETLRDTRKNVTEYNDNPKIIVQRQCSWIYH